MRKFLRSLSLAAVVLLPLAAAAQQQKQYNKAGVGVHFGGNDFYGPQTGKYFTDNWYRINGTETDTNKGPRWFPQVRATYWQQLNRFLDVSAGLSIGNVDYPAGKDDSLFINRRQTNDTRNLQIHTALDLRLVVNILPRDEYLISPYVHGGASGTFHPANFGFNVPVGAGINIGLDHDKQFFLNLESAYRIPVTSHEVASLQHNIGVVYWFQRGYKKPAEPTYAELLPPPDMDRDGVTDSLDACPTIAGLPEFGGCPDTDGDGVGDNTDGCPLVAGTVAFNGCPDTDGDGTPDQLDQCPYVAGTAELKGCPVPDKDGDGFNDSEDRCPDAYSKTNGGCPEVRREIIERVNKAAKAIFYETGKATIKKNSFKGLDAIVATLQENPELFVAVEGHTDNVGNDDFNLKLSQERAESVIKYFTEKGIDASRLEAKGFGETMPVATNESAAGKAQNRRTEIKVRNYR